MRIRVVTWNIHKAIGGIDRRYSIGRVIEALEKIHADLALLQEVADDLPRSKFHDQAEMLAEALNMPHLAFHPEHRFSIGGYGNAILSRWPLSNVHHVDLTIGWRKKRGVLQARARIRLPHGRSRSVYIHNMHLGLAGSERGRQLETFLASEPFSRLHERTPIVVGGDLNDLWGTLGPRFMVPRGFARAGQLANTFPAAMPVRPLDGMFVRGDLHAVRTHVWRSELTAQASDHLPLVADLELKGAGVRRTSSPPPSSRGHRACAVNP
jgi:endonuclease/exonuclease/phosphatase family metal-dependent hydrolase